jgi:hypothetical protein
MDELRNLIWDYLYSTSRAQSVESIASQVAHDPQTIRAAIDHEWFEVTDDLVAIALRQQDTLPPSRGPI